jgi:thiol-disulfide isomerase/thioredoxin
VSDPENPRPRQTPTRLIVAVLGIAVVAIAAAILAGNAGLFGIAQTGPCAPQVAAAKSVDAAATGELAALNGTGTGRGYADLPFADANGKPVTIADFAGKYLLVNFWASWCGPCRAEMPALDKLAASENGPDFAVISIDSSEAAPEKGLAYFKAGGWPNLVYHGERSFNDTFGRLQKAAVALGLPTTLLLDKKGCEIGVLQGPAAWDTPDGKRVIDALKAI